MEYKWKRAVFNADATAVGQEIEKIEVDGEVNTDTLLTFARHNRDSELYKCFEWDDTIAGEKYRKAQASQILCSISIVTNKEESEKETVRAYVSVKTGEEQKRTFKNLSRVLENDEEYQQLKDKARNDFENTKEKYEKVLQLSDLRDVIFDLYRNV